MMPIKEIEKLEEKLKGVLSKNDAFLVRKYSNQQLRHVIDEVIDRNQQQAELINEVYSNWTDFRRLIP